MFINTIFFSLFPAYVRISLAKERIAGAVVIEFYRHIKANLSRRVSRLFRVRYLQFVPDYLRFGLCLSRRIGN